MLWDMQGMHICRSWGAAAGGVAVLALGLLLAPVLAAAPPATAATEPVAVLEETLGAGEYRVGELGYLQVSLDNPGPGALTLERVRLSCDCMWVVRCPVQVPPGARAPVQLGIVPQKAGTPDYSVWLETLAGDTGKVVRHVAIDMTVRPAAAPATVTRLPAGIALDLLTVRERLPVADVYVHPRDAVAAVAAGKPWFSVDVRDKAAFAAANIPGSVNLALHTLRVNPALRERRVLLVDQGAGDPALEEECVRLRQQPGLGSVFVLRHGLSGWVAAGGRLNASESAKAQLPFLSPAAWYQVRTRAGWIVLDATAGAESITPFLFPQRSPWPAGGAQAALDAVAAALKADTSGWPAVLVVTATGDSAALRATAARITACPVFFLAGGTAGLADWLRQQSALRQKGEVKVSRPEPCTHCP